MLSEVYPKDSKSSADNGSPALSPQTVMRLPMASDLAHSSCKQRTTAGWKQSKKRLTLGLERSTASKYWIKSLLPIEKKSTSRANSSMR